MKKHPKRNKRQIKMLSSKFDKGIYPYLKVVSLEQLVNLYDKLEGRSSITWVKGVSVYGIKLRDQSRIPEEIIRHQIPYLAIKIDRTLRTDKAFLYCNRDICEPYGVIVKENEFVYLAAKYAPKEKKR